MNPRPKELSIRFVEEGDAVYLKNWLSQPSTLFGFTMTGEKEINDSVQVWMNYSKSNRGLTALWNGVPCGMALLYLQSFEKLAHTCLFSIVIDEEKRGKGIGTALLQDLMALAKDDCQIEILHLEVFEDNPAIHLYQKMGFSLYGKQKHFSLEPDGSYRTKLFMQKAL